MGSAEANDIEPADGRELKGAAMRERLRAATEALIAEAGIEAATQMEVARRCGVSRGALLHHYPTRNDLIIDTARHFWLRGRDMVAALADDMARGRTNVGVFVERLYDELFRARSVVTMLELLVGGRAEAEIGRAVEDNLTDLFRSYEELGALAFRARGIAPERVHIIITLIVSTLRGLRLQQIVDPGHDRTYEVREALVRAVEHLFADEAARKTVKKRKKS